MTAPAPRRLTSPEQIAAAGAERVAAGLRPSSKSAIEKVAAILSGALQKDNTGSEESEPAA